MIRARYTRYPLHFRQPAGTSRGVLRWKDCWFVILTGHDGRTGVGEVSYIPGLSVEDWDHAGGPPGVKGPARVERGLDQLCSDISGGERDPVQPLPELPGVQFALETAVKDLETGGSRVLFPSGFTAGRSGIPTNGLIWMGTRDFMAEQVRQKIASGFRVLKMKVGALDFREELDLLKWVRSEFFIADLEIRLDANGAWTPGEASEKMETLAGFGIHSIEQPIRAGQPEAMASLCRDAAIPVALDEELIGIHDPVARRQLLRLVNPSYVILKPGLLGGFTAAEDWVSAAGDTGTAWWVTSALESNIGLNAIAQWAWQQGVENPQGLGTGQLYGNNIVSPLRMEGDRLWYRDEAGWDLGVIGI